jgi:mannosyl-3-phosphoglycerate phosphatase
VIELGEPYNRLIDIFRLLRSGPPDFGVVGFSDLTVKELAMERGMTLDEAARAKAREYSEPFRFTDISPAKMDVFLERIRQSGRQFAIGGRYYHLQGSYDKGRAVDILNHMFKRVHRQITTIGIGDSQNDAPMLGKVDKPVIVKRPSGVHKPELVAQYPKALLTDGIGPKGWAEAVLRMVSEEN